MRTKEETEESFRQDLKYILDKYNAEMSAKDHWQGYPECGEDIRITFDIPAEWDNEHNLVQEMTEIEFKY